MERFGNNRGNVLLGHYPSSSMAPSSSSSSRNYDDVDVDFDDVFGGPPRRSAIHEARHSFGGGGRIIDSSDVVSRSPWAGISSEKPVFGEESGDRRRQGSNDFYDDIFRGSDGSYSSPRKSSTPGSRVLSPARSLPPKTDVFGTSLPAQFSLPAKLTKAVDLPTFGSSPRSANKHKDGSSTPNTSLSRFSSQSFQDQNSQNLLSPELPLSQDEASFVTKLNEIEVRGNLKGSAKRLQVLVQKGQFHFSIYKWPTTGIPILSPLGDGMRATFKENGKFERSLSSKGVVEREVEGLRNPKSQPLENIQRGEIKPDSLPEIGLSDGNKKENSSVKQEINKTSLKPLRSMLYDDIEKQGGDYTLKNADEKEYMEKATTVTAGANVDVTSNTKKLDEKKRSSKRSEVNKDPVSSPGKNRVKEKVKDFVKIFNHETPSMNKVNVDGRSQGSRWKGMKNTGADVEVTANAAMENKKAVPIVNLKPDVSFKVEEKSEKSKKRNSGQKTKKPEVNTKPDSSFTVDETIGKSKKQQSSNIPVKSNASLMAEEKSEKLKKQQSGEKFKNPDTSFTVEKGTDNSNKTRHEPKPTIHKSNDNSTAQMDASQRPDSFARRSNVTVVDIDEMFGDNFQIQELGPEEEKPSENKDLDSKIQQWSNGKIGNIRSLLSTLQLVLWAESGWKPIALMDVIEGNQVKKAYQRALLCLHPDKLQQKGAAPHQKYIAEKVFDILQEAWDHFNSIGSTL